MHVGDRHHTLNRIYAWCVLNSFRAIRRHSAGYCVPMSIWVFGSLGGWVKFWAFRLHIGHPDRAFSFRPGWGNNRTSTPSPSLSTCSGQLCAVDVGTTSGEAPRTFWQLNSQVLVPA